MSRKPWTAAVIALLLLAAALIWRFWGGSNISPPNPADSLTRQSAPLTLEQQTPVRMPTGEDQSGGSDSSAEAETDANATASSAKYNFNSAEEALNFYANLVAAKFDQLKSDGSVVPPENLDGIYANELVSWEDRWYGGMATTIVFNTIFEQKNEPGMLQALIPHVNEWEQDDWAPDPLMVRAGRWPSALLRNEVVLPNGQVIDLNTMKNKRIVVKYRMLSVLDEVGQQAVKDHQKREAEIIARLDSGAASETEAAALQKELAKIQMDLEIALTPEYGEGMRIYYSGDSVENVLDNPDIEEVVFDLGYIDEDLSRKGSGK